MRAAALTASAAVLLMVLVPAWTIAQDSECTAPGKRLEDEGFDLPTPCAGAFKAEFVMQWSVWAVTECRANKWRSQDGPAGNLEVRISIDCGPSQDEPVCLPPTNTAPAYRGVANGTALFVLSLTDIILENGFCTAGLLHEDEEEVPAEGCQGPFCCGLEGECIAEGRVFNPTSCACVLPPPPPPSRPEPCTICRVYDCELVKDADGGPYLDCEYVGDQCCRTDAGASSESNPCAAWLRAQQCEFGSICCIDPVVAYTPPSCASKGWWDETAASACQGACGGACESAWISVLDRGTGQPASTRSCLRCGQPQGLSCGALGGDYCSQSGSCPGGYESLGGSSDCDPCCKSQPPPDPGPSCGALGGDYCSQSGSCPGGYDSLGQSYDCNPCCKSQPPPPTCYDTCYNRVCDTDWRWVDDWCESCSTVCDTCWDCQTYCDEDGNCWEECSPYDCNCHDECSSFVCGGHWEPYETNCREEPYECNPHPCP
jgi:hypothetical protein